MTVSAAQGLSAAQGWSGGTATEREGLRERKKRLMRRQLSDTATRLFLEHGFDAVRVAEVAEACGVSEKTVFNYFPTKEALLLDRLEATAHAADRYLTDPELPPVEAMLTVLQGEREGLGHGLSAAPDPDEALARYRRFGDLIRSTPSLLAYRGEVADRFAARAAQLLAGRSGASPTDPEPQIAATALVGLWRLQFESLRTHLRPGCAVADALAAVTDDVERAARVIRTGLATWPGAGEGTPPDRPGAAPR